MEKPISAWQGMTDEQRAKQREYHKRYNDKIKADPEKYEHLKAQRRANAKRQYAMKREELLAKANRRYREAHGLPLEDGKASESFMLKRINMQMESKQKQLAELIDSIEALRQKAEAERERISDNALRKISLARERQKLKEKKGDPPPCFPPGSLTWDLKDAVLYSKQDD